MIKLKQYNWMLVSADRHEESISLTDSTTGSRSSIRIRSNYCTACSEIVIIEFSHLVFTAFSALNVNTPITILALKFMHIKQFLSFQFVGVSLFCSITFSNDAVFLSFGTVFLSSVEANVSEKHTVSIFSPEDGDRIFLQNGIYRQVYTVPKPRRTASSSSLP
jgi:hypothetical protein